ncbi:acyl carrier protein [Amycolatopsis sp. NPDC059021]|uniref:acyl carrier protein n=1 Tax=Amycolatopsis sp. NPDC059021 TaxID=3346704 RepID=UPI00366B946B
MADSKVSAQVREIITEMSPLDDHTVSSADRLMEDLGLDSMTLVELSLVLESEFELGPIDDDAPTLVTVGDVEELIGRAVADRI